MRERKALTLEDAIHKMTALPASRVRLADRGRLAVGLAADVVVFDPATVADRATFEEPFQYPVGIKAVIVNGGVALLDGNRQAARAGTGLRPREWGLGSDPGSDANQATPASMSDVSANVLPSLSLKMLLVPHGSCLGGITYSTPRAESSS